MERRDGGDRGRKMADLTNTEKRQFERLLGMASGYVLDFSNRTFAEFVTDATGRDPYDAKYDHAATRRQTGCGVSGRPSRTG